jgi:hypothetical protein
MPVRTTPSTSQNSWHLGVGRDAQRLEADGHRLAQRDDAAHDRQPQQPVAAQLEHGLTPDGPIARSDQRPVGGPGGVGHREAL